MFFFASDDSVRRAYCRSIGAIIERMPSSSRASELDDALLSVWRQTLLDKKRDVTVGGQPFRVRKTSKHGLAQVDFEVAGFRVRGLEQNPQTASRWAQMARKGAKVMQFLSGGRYFAVVADGKVTHYSR
jgi:hypothetical protein